MEKDNSEGLQPFHLTLEEIKPHLLISNLSEAELIRLIKEMSIKFTSQRDQISDYVLEHRHVSAYASFYLPTNIPKLHFLLSKLSNHTLKDFTNRPFIDVGCGPGTYSLAYKKLMNIGSHVEMIGVDTSQIMLDQATKIMNGFFPKDKFQTFRKYSEKMSNSILFFGHAINELGIKKTQDLIVSVDPEYVMWIEPGTSDLFQDLKQLRQSLVEHYDLLYPCPSNENCPSSWCHQVLRVSHDQSVERLSQLVSLDRKTLPMSAQVYKRKNKIHASNSPVTIQFMNETKFSFEYKICYLENNKNTNAIIELQKKHLSKEEEKNLKNANIGERINFEVDKKIGDKLRVKFLK